MAFNGDITLNRSRYGLYSGIRYGDFGTYIVLISRPTPSELNDGSKNAVIRISRGNFETTEPDTIFNSTEIHTAELNCIAPTTEDELK